MQAENIDYGFRRNLTAIRASGLTILRLVAVADIVVAAVGGTTAINTISVGVMVLLCALGWTKVRRSWVEEQALNYARRLFESLEGPALDPPRTDTSA